MLWTELITANLLNKWLTGVHLFLCCTPQSGLGTSPHTAHTEGRLQSQMGSFLKASKECRGHCQGGWPGMRQAGAAGAYAVCTGSLAAPKSGSGAVVGPPLPMINLCVRTGMSPQQCRHSCCMPRGL